MTINSNTLSDEMRKRMGLPVAKARTERGKGRVAKAKAKARKATIPYACTTGEDGAVIVTLPIRTVSEANCRDDWHKKAARVKEQRATIGVLLGIHYRKFPAIPWLVTLVRLGGKMLDDDNLRSAFKAIRDGVAQVAHVDDGSGQVRFIYDQVIGGPQGVRIEIRPLVSPTTPTAARG